MRLQNYFCNGTDLAQGGAFLSVKQGTAPSSKNIKKYKEPKKNKMCESYRDVLVPYLMGLPMDHDVDQNGHLKEIRTLLCFSLKIQLVFCATCAITIFIGVEKQCKMRTNLKNKQKDRSKTIKNTVVFRIFHIFCFLPFYFFFSYFL